MKNVLIKNIDKIHTTIMGEERIRRNLKLNNEDAVKFCKTKLLDGRSTVYKKGKNYYCEIDDVVITINSFSCTIITAHKIKGE